MPLKCCVPGCKSNYKSEAKSHTRVFKFPEEESARCEWLKCIPRKDWTPSKNSVVCIKHFHESDISRVEKYKNADGEWKEFPRNTPILIPGAIPRIFPGLPSYFSVEEKKQRKNPDDRRQEYVDTYEHRVEEWLDSDRIQNFCHLNLKICEKVQQDEWNVHKNERTIVVYKCHFDCSIPKIAASVSITPEMKVTVCRDGKILTKHDLSWVLPENLKLTLWSQLENLLTRYGNITDCINEPPNVRSLYSDIDSKFSSLKSLIADECENTPIEKQLNFVHDQFKLIFSKVHKYTINMLVWSFMVFIQSPSCYSAIRETCSLVLPNPKYLRQLSSSFSISPSSDAQNRNFLQQSAKNLIEREKYVTLQLDEIYINSKIEYKGGKIVGSAENNPLLEARTIQAFLISSVYGKFKEVASLHPVKNITGNELYDLTIKVIELIQSCGFYIVAVISDNNRLNRNMFGKFLTPLSSHVMQLDMSPCKTFITFDPVHIFKSIRNNWLNLKDADKTFIFPPFDDLNGTPLKAKFSDLRNFYKLKCTSRLLTTGNKLNYKSLYPSNLERQKVSLVANIFHETTYSALKIEYESNSNIVTSNGTFDFIQIILKWWTIMNIKSKFTGMLHRNDDAKPFSSTSDPRLKFLEIFSLWLDRWRILGQGCLTVDTLNSLHHCTNALISFIVYSLDTLKVPYILPGKLQTDNLERRFSSYRQLSGGNYNVSVTQVLEAEKKMRIKSMLGLKSAKYGTLPFTLSSLPRVSEENMFEEEEDIPTQLERFNPILETNYLDAPLDESSLLYISGYAAFKLLMKVSCPLCSMSLTSQNEDYEDRYIQELNRGGLTFPSENIIRVGKHVFGIMSCLISAEYEEEFLLLQAQKKILVSLAKQGVSCDHNLVFDACECGISDTFIVDNIVSVFGNILLNNYSKRRNDELARNCTSGKKRKLMTYNN